MNQDEQNLNLLGIFHYVLGALTCLASCLFIIHIVLGTMMVRGTLDDGKNAPPDAFGWLFVAMGSLAVLCGWALGMLMIIAGRKLQKREWRVFCIVIAGIECMLTPLGTVLGVFTIITLTKDSVVKLFEGNHPGAGPRDLQSSSEV